MKNVFNEAVVTNPEEVKGGTLFLLSWLFGGYKRNNCGCGYGGGYSYSHKSGYSKW